MPLITTQWANTGSAHSLARAPHAAVEHARGQLAAWAGARSKDVVFCSGATEANNLVVLGAQGRVLCSATEHPSVLEPVQLRGGNVIPVDRDGRLDLAFLEEELSKGAALLSVLAANNETGVLQDTPAIHALSQAAGVPLHLDCAQLVGRHAAPEHWEYMTVTGHKAGGLKGAGALLRRQGRHLQANSHGGGQERGFRAGTLNPAPIASLGVVATLAHSAETKAHRDRLEAACVALGGRVSGRGAPRLWNTCNVVFEGIQSDMLVVGLDLEGVCASAGSACASGAANASTVLLAMGIEHSALRLSLGWSTTAQDITRAIEALQVVVARQRALGSESWQG
ncbi:MAG: cysteine desulfurase [Cognaticolwellia sp.]|jgi:cysteine desulfurase